MHVAGEPGMGTEGSGRAAGAVSGRGREPLRVVLGVADAARCRGYQRLLAREGDILVVGEAHTCNQVLAMAGLDPDVLVLDSRLCPGYAPVLLHAVRRESPATRVLLLASPGLTPDLWAALAHGCRGYLDPRRAAPLLGRAVRAVGTGEAWVPRRMVGGLAEWLTLLADQSDSHPVQSGGLPSPP